MKSADSLFFWRQVTMEIYRLYLIEIAKDKDRIK